MNGAPARGTALHEGRYELDRELGRGGAASVWLARDTLLERRVAVKILSEALCSDDEWLARFRREARLAARLQHPNLVSVFDFGADGERPYLVMAHLPGGTLEERIAEGEPIACEELARDLLEALTHIHEAGIVHRDVKPGNVLFARDGRALLSDFGVARPGEATSLTQPGQIPGTARYMAPELWRGEPATVRSDLYSCGVLLARCLSAGASARMHSLVEALTREEPDERPPSARAALALLDRPATARPTQAFQSVAAPAAPTGSAPGPIGSPRRVGAMLALSLGTVVLAVALIIGLGGQEPADDAPGERSLRAQEGSGARDAGGANDDREQPPPAHDGPAGRAPSAAGDDPGLGAQLNDAGYALIQQGRYEEAVPLLRRAVRAFPQGTSDLNYAYALYNLGNALRLAGRPAEAIPVLRERLAIPDQTSVVRRELAAARQELRSN